MTTPRWDRVLPIFEDEQVLLTRLMADRLVPGHLVLDIGTGSGVFAIWAASKGQSRVVAIDVSKRALLFAKANARRNKIPVATNSGGLQSGRVLFRNVSITAFARRAKAHGILFDLIILNPPFNPTCGVVKPALHADAGPIAQRPFERQIRLVPSLLKPGGYCVGVQMSYDADERHIRAVDIIGRAFRRRCQTVYAHAHSKPRTISVDALVRHEYKAWLDGAMGTKADQTKVRSFVRRIGSQGQRFSLIHYQVRKDLHATEGPSHQLQLPVAARLSWAPRLWCHKCIAECAAPWPQKTSQSR